MLARMLAFSSKNVGKHVSSFSHDAKTKAEHLVLMLRPPRLRPDV